MRYSTGTDSSVFATFACWMVLVSNRNEL